MNKTQINFCRDRIQTIAKQKEAEIRTDANYLPELTKEQKIAQIQNGKATLKLNEYAGDSCPYHMGYIDSMFEWDGEAEIIGKNDAISNKVGAVTKKMQADADNLIDEFVLGEITEAKAISRFKAKKYTL